MRGIAGLVLLLASTAQAAPPCGAPVARLPRRGVTAVARCPAGADGQLFDGAELTLAPRASLRLEAGAAAAVSDVVCSSRAAQPVTLVLHAATAPAPVGIEVRGVACAPWADDATRCPPAGAAVLECEAFPRQLSVTTDAQALRRQLGSALRGEGEDERMQAWVRLADQKDWPALARDAESALREHPPHREAARVFVLAHDRTGDLDDALGGVRSPKLHRRLTDLADAWRARHHDPEAFPPSRIGQIVDPWAAVWVAEAAREAHDPGLAWQAVQHALAVDDQAFSAVDLAAHLPGPAPAALPQTARDYRAAVEKGREVEALTAWIAAAPNDAAAIEHLDGLQHRARPSRLDPFLGR